MPISRQLRYQQQCRDNWKENATKKQEKIREYVQLTRSLKKSRDSWKDRAKKAEQRVKELEKQMGITSSTENAKNSSPDSSSDNDDNDEDCDRIAHHHYTLSTISIAVQQIITVGHSYRGVAKTMKLTSRDDSPHYSSIKTWVERIGLYELQRPKQSRDDWIYLVDLTVELGNTKSLVIYGIPHTIWLTQILPKNRGLKPTDGEILTVEVTEQATGEWVYSALASLSQKTGTPFQIISDQASNLKKGIELFQTLHPQVIYTYDVTHAMANLLKRKLLDDELFQNFLQECHLCRQQVQQTELAFAAPPSQRSKCRYFNLYGLINWATKILGSSLSLFSQLIPGISLSQLALRLEEKFGWLSAYGFSLWLWQYLILMTHTLLKQLKTLGLNSDSVTLYKQSLSSLKIPESLAPFTEQILTYLNQQIHSTHSLPLLATTDVLESIFGRYKYFSERSPIKELRSSLLTIPLTTINFTPEFIRNALTTVRSVDLSQWVNKTFGQSQLTKRKILFSH
ncbi:hypothetical protein [Gloeothece verrucosa]|uniref:Transposase n=1 Tax=Gloeothece verrucosa (strain PCC 7822) TaxID=497965 RepID=E0UM54_GLOV7|nr:hypothetical protein [Gloeothece verrucosa]ADN18034.1 conserved hypothetical protein [Gloeothece verrucosa PCC 7822]